MFILQCIFTINITFLGGMQTYAPNCTLPFHRPSMLVRIYIKIFNDFLTTYNADVKHATLHYSAPFTADFYCNPFSLNV